jgi:Type II secretion system (T2SS), protein G
MPVREMTNQARTLPCLVIACLVGFMVAGLALVAAWGQAQSNPYLEGYNQSTTHRLLKQVDAAIQRYRQTTGTLPRTLGQLSGDPDLPFRISEDGTIRDGWYNPLVYSVQGDRYLIISYGKDGKPGGTGINYDLTQLKPDPPEAQLTFRQFLSHPRTQKMLSCSPIAGALAMILTFVLLRPSDLTRKGIIGLGFKLGLTLAATLFVGVIIAGLHAPVGH